MLKLFSNLKVCLVGEWAICNMKVFKERGILDRKKGSGGINKTTSRDVCLKRLMVNKKWGEID